MAAKAQARRSLKVERGVAKALGIGAQRVRSWVYPARDHAHRLRGVYVHLWADVVLGGLPAADVGQAVAGIQALTAPGWTSWLWSPDAYVSVRAGGPGAGDVGGAGTGGPT